MACIAGTRSAPKTWFRVRAHDIIQIEGRQCARLADKTSIKHRIGRRWSENRGCSGCPAYRGHEVDGSIATGRAANGEPYALTEREYDLYLDDPAAYQRDKDRGMSVESWLRAGMSRDMLDDDDLVAVRTADAARAKAYRARKRTVTDTRLSSSLDGATNG